MRIHKNSIQKLIPKIDDNRKAKYLLEPLTAIHLRSKANIDISTTNSDIKYIYLLPSKRMFP